MKRLLEPEAATEETAGERWDAAVREDHRKLRTRSNVLDSALRIHVPDEDRRIVLCWTLRNLWPDLELHLRKEEEEMPRKEHADLRASFRRLAELLQDPTHLEWTRIELAVDGFLHLLEEHEKRYRQDRP